MTQALSEEHRQQLASKLKQFKNKSENVGIRGDSVFLRKISDKKSFDLCILEDFEELSESCYEFILKGKKSICVVRSSDHTVPGEKNSARLRALLRTTNFIEEEKGQYILFLGFPFVEGFLNDMATYVRAPLILFPIRLEFEKSKKPSGWYLHIDEERSPIINRALFSFLKSTNYVYPPDTLEENVIDLLEKISDNDSLNYKEKFFEELFKILDSFQFKYDKNSDVKKTEIIPVIKKEDFVKLEKKNLRIKNSIVIGIFPQGNVAISADYDSLIEKVSQGNGDLGIIDSLLELPVEDEWNPSSSSEAEVMELDQVSDMEINTVLPSDASQDEILISSQNEKCTVVRGPPGTGKSQVIVNLIANAISKNQKVLVVCQKRAALDVVAQRLEREGLGDYVTLVEDSQRDRPALYRKFKRFLESEVTNNSTNQPTSSGLNFTSKDIDKRIAVLSNLVKALSKIYFDGISIRQLYVGISPNYIPKLPLKGIADKLTVHELDQLLNLLPTIQSSAIKFDDPSHPWFDRKDLSNFSSLDQRKIIEELEKITASSNAEIFDLEIFVLKRLKQSFEILKNKSGFLSSFNKEKKEAFAFIEDTLKLKISKSDNYDMFVTKIENELNFRQSLEQFKLVLSDSFVDNLRAQPIGKIKDFLSQLKNTASEISQIQNYDSQINFLNEIQRKIVKICVSDFTTHNQNWTEIIKNEIYAHWIDIIEKDNPILQGEPFEYYITQKGNLKNLLEKKRELLKQKLISDLQARIKTIPRFKQKRTLEETNWAKFIADVSKQRKLKSLRKLFFEYRDLLFSIAPCWLMTPQSASEVFPQERAMFDLVIYDEASQCPVEDVLPSLYRGKNIVIAGDEKQLRPFDLFRIKDDTDDDEEDDGPIKSESLFILAKRIYHPRYLNWHYRSLYQDLIDFSNYAFYDGRLQVAPDVIRNPKKTSIRWIQCNGIWHERVNHVEAVRVVDEIKNIILENKEEKKFPSIGVITFNEKQQTVIQDEMEKRSANDPEFDELLSFAKDKYGGKKDKELFIKNIENVQGDERDIIIFSIAYGKDPEGKFHMLFGTLSREGGENRLNVAVTRARQEIVVICSIDPSEIKPDENRSSGRQRLKDYLEYAKAVGEVNQLKKSQILKSLNDGMIRSASDKNKIFDSYFEKLVCEKLLAQNYEVATQVGVSSYRIDLAVVHPDDQSKYILGIECDGANFHSAKSTRERDVMRQDFLENRGWKIERIWSTKWWRNPKNEIDRIVSKIEELRKIPN